MPPRYRDQHRGGMRRVLAGGEAHIIGRTVEVEGLHRDGHEFPVELALSRWATASGKFFTAIIRDITERRHAEETLRINSTALTAADNAIIIADRNGLIEWVNPAFTALTGYTAAEAMGRNPRDLAKSGKEDDAFYKELWATLLSGKVWRNEIVSRRKDGSLYTESMTVTPVPDKKGGIGHFIAIKEDITVRKSAESRIREQAEIIDKAPLIIVVSDLSNRTTSFSKGAAHLLGIKREEALGRTADELFSAQTMRHLGHGRSVAMATGLWRGEVPFQTRDGRPITVEFLMFLIRDDAGRPIGRISIGTDITEKKQFEEQALRAQRIENLGTLAAGIAHDFNNALAPIIMAGPLLQKLVTDPSAQQMLNIVNTSSARSAALVRQMLSFARGTSSEKLLAQIDHVLREVIDLARSSFPKSIEIDTDLPNDLWPIMGDPTQMHQVFLNLCVNARDAMPEGGKLTVAARNRVLDAAQAAKIEGGRAGNFLTVEVRDTGTGIAPEVLEKMFEPFFTTKDVGKGTGLGLSTVLGIVSHHDGFVSVHTSTARDRGHGTEFTVYLPAAAGEVAGPPQAHGNLPQRGRGELILVVDDEESVRAICSKVLISQGYQVVTATDGVNAIEVFGKHTHEIKLLLTDAQMPGLGGAALISALRRMNPGLPVISMSGAAAPSGKEHRMSAEAFLPKPFEAMTLLVMVRRQLDEASVPLKQRPAT
jgi:two-component system cell cycle sensor histidine kinase/response regulator CckA